MRWAALWAAGLAQRSSVVQQTSTCTGEAGKATCQGYLNREAAGLKPYSECVTVTFDEDVGGITKRFAVVKVDLACVGADLFGTGEAMTGQEACLVAGEVSMEWADKYRLAQARGCRAAEGFLLMAYDCRIDCEAGADGDTSAEGKRGVLRCEHMIDPRGTFGIRDQAKVDCTGGWKERCQNDETQVVELTCNVTSAPTTTTATGTRAAALDEDLSAERLALEAADAEETFGAMFVGICIPVALVMLYTTYKKGYCDKCCRRKGPTFKKVKVPAPDGAKV